MSKGIIVINPFLIPFQTVKQAVRLKDEFEKIGVETDIVSNGYLLNRIENGKISSDLSGADFIVYLDKDKYLSSLLEKMGYRLFNSHNAVRVCDDKAETYIALSNNNFNLPNTIFGALCYSKKCKIDEDSVEQIIDNLSLPLIVKECYGSMGKGIYLVKSKKQLKSVMKKVKLKPHLFQSYVSSKPGVDVRLIVIGGKVVAYMERVNVKDFRSNIARGGFGRVCSIPTSFIEEAQRIAKVLQLDYCGVDLLYGKDNKPVVCEVNSNAFFDGIEMVTGVNVAKCYAEYILSKIKN